MKKAKKELTLENMTISDVFKMDLFFENVVQAIENQKKSFNVSKSKGFKIAHWAESLVDRITPGGIIVTYAEILEKKNVEYSSNERKLIQSICSNAYNETIKELINRSYDKEHLNELIQQKNEKKRDTSHRSDK